MFFDDFTIGKGELDIFLHLSLISHFIKIPVMLEFYCDLRYNVLNGKLTCSDIELKKKNIIKDGV